MNEIERSRSSAESQNEPKTSNQRRAGVIVAAGKGCRLSKERKVCSHPTGDALDTKRSAAEV